MNSKKVTENAKRYYERLKLRYPPERADAKYKGSDHIIWLRHACWLAQNAPCFFIKGDPNKAGRWVTAVQNILLAQGIYSIEELQIHSMPEGAIYNRDG